jgi:hypothetical protein
VYTSNIASYGFCIDILNVIAQFQDNTATVIKVEDWSHKAPYPKDMIPAAPDNKSNKHKTKSKKGSAPNKKQKVADASNPKT